MARPAKHTKTAAVKAVKDAAAEAKATAVKAQEKLLKLLQRPPQEKPARPAYA